MPGLILASGGQRLAARTAHVAAHGPTQQSRATRAGAGAGNQTSPADVSYMMPDFTIALAIGLAIGFILGFGLRAIISYRRRRRARRRAYLL
jgi:hypothetical protein